MKGTPYRLGGRVVGAGVDCATTLLIYLQEIGAIDPATLGSLPPYRHDWFHHTNKNPYLKAMLQCGRLVAESTCRPGIGREPGNLALFMAVNRRNFDHGAIITRWPMGIAALGEGVREVDLQSHRLTAQRPMDVFDPWQKPKTRIARMG